LISDIQDTQAHVKTTKENTRQTRPYTNAGQKNLEWARMTINMNTHLTQCKNKVTYADAIDTN